MVEDMRRSARFMLESTCVFQSLLCCAVLSVSMTQEPLHGFSCVESGADGTYCRVSSGEGRRMYRRCYVGYIRISSGRRQEV